MKVKFSLCFCLCVLLTVVNAKHVKSKPDDAEEDVYGDLLSTDEKVQNDYAEYYDKVEPTAENSDVQSNDDIDVEFRTKPQVFIAKINEVVRLPCEVTNSEEVVLVWQKDGTLLYQGDMSLGQFPNIKKGSNGTLEVHLRSEKDFGNYTCKIMINNYPKIVHQVVHLTAPTILAIETVENRRTYKVGETLKLTCNTTGFPKPKISWHKDNKRLETEGETLIIEDLKFRDAGIYRCLADNKIEPPAHYNITIHVEHKPIVSIEKYIVNSDKEYDAELKCTVHAYPQATVVWKKDNVNVKSSPPKVKLERRQSNIENILIITNLTDEDFGQYTCSARNAIDKVEKAVNLVKTPAVQGLDKPEKVNKDFVLTWKVESKSPIAEHELQYRKTGEQQWKDIKPEVTKADKDIYIVKHTLKDLDAGNYEIRVRSRNVHGWSDYSDVITFDGVLAKNGSHHKSHNKKHHKEKNLREKQVAPTTPETPAQPQEHERSEASVEEKQSTPITPATPARHEVVHSNLSIKEKQPTPITPAAPARQEYNHSNSSIKERQSSATMPVTPALHQEYNRSNSSVKGKGNSGYSLVPSTVPVISIALITLFHHRQ